VPTNDLSGLKLDMADYVGVSCEFAVPSKTNFNISGDNGKIQITEPRFNVKLNMTNGVLDLAPSSAVSYKYDLGVNNGKMDTFPPTQKSDSSESYTISAHLVNGTIRREE
jgi:hypothetical protein